MSTVWRSRLRRAPPRRSRCGSLPRSWYGALDATGAFLTENIDKTTVHGFGNEWSRFDQAGLPAEERERLFEQYFRLFPWAALPAGAQGFDLGCGSGRWAAVVAPRVGCLHCIDASADAVDVARRNLATNHNCKFHVASVAAIPLDDDSMDFGYSLGVLHDVPDTASALASCVRKLKRGAPFLVYLYYRFDNRPVWFRRLWEASDAGRRVISRLPYGARHVVADAIASTVYWPLARGARVADAFGANVSNLPLFGYRKASFYTMRTDALDRFGTRLEQRFTKNEISGMLDRAGLERVAFSDEAPFWCAMGYRR